MSKYSEHPSKEHRRAINTVIAVAGLMFLIGMLYATTSFNVIHTLGWIALALSVGALFVIGDRLGLINGLDDAPAAIEGVDNLPA